MPLPKFLAISFEKHVRSDKGARYESLHQPTCSFCEMNIENPPLGLILKNCDHCIHKGCLEDMFRLNKTKCA